MIIGLFIILIVLFIFLLLAEPEISIVPFLALLFLSIVTLVNVFSHTEDVATVNKYHLVIEAKEKTIAELESVLKNTMGTASPNVKLLLNADTPVAALVSNLTSRYASLEKAREKIGEAMVAIEARKLSPFWFIVSIYGEPITKE